MDRQYSFEDFVGIVAALRGENGCPWDREQTHKSLRPCMMEEAAELVSSIRIYEDTGNAENMREELGDILLQVVMHSQIAKEEGLFTLEDVVNDISAKMVRRHPHVFGKQVQVEGSGEVLANWDEIKRKEKEGKTWIESPLREIPKELPALTRAPKVLKKVDKLYEAGDSYSDNVQKLEQIVAKMKEWKPGTDNMQLENMIGDILIRISDIARLYRISQEQILADKIEDLIERYEPMPKP